MASDQSTAKATVVTTVGVFRILIDGATVACVANTLAGDTYTVGNRVTVLIRNPKPPLVQGIES